MFDELDDPNEHEFAPTVVSDVRRRASSGRRRRLIARSMGATVVVMALVAGGLAWRYSRMLNRTIVLEIDPSRIPQDLSAPMNILVVGWDETARSDIGDRTGVAGRYADFIRIVRVDPQGPTRILAIPRDLEISNPTNPESGNPRINSALNLVSEAAATIERLGIPIDHAAGIDMDGVIEVVDALGGIDLMLKPSASRAGEIVSDQNVGLAEPIDPTTGLTMCRTWSGREVLQLLRARNVTGGNNGNRGRVIRQTQIAQAMFAQLSPQKWNPLSVDQVIRTAGDHLEVDTQFDLSLMVDIATRMSATNVIYQSVETADYTEPVSGRALERIVGNASNEALWRSFGADSGPTGTILAEPLTEVAPTDTPPIEADIVQVIACDA